MLFYRFFIICFCLFCLPSSGALGKGNDDAEFLNRIGKNSSEYDILSLGHRNLEENIIDVLQQKDANDQKISELRNATTGSNNKKDAQMECYIIEKVNGVPVTNIDVLNAIRFIFFSAGKAYDENIAKLMMPSVVASLADRKIHQLCADRMGIDVPEAHIKNMIDQIAKNNNLTIEQLELKAQEFGIDINIFKEETKAQVILFSLSDALSGMLRPTKQEIDAELAGIKETLKSKRYLLLDIFFKVDDEKNDKAVRANAESVLALMKAGFNPRILSEILSQKAHIGNFSTFDFVDEKKLEKSEQEALKTMSCDSSSAVLKVNYGYKIIYLADKAMPNKKEDSAFSYKVLQTNIQFNSTLLLAKDKERHQAMLHDLFHAKNIQQYKAVCTKYQLSCDEQKIDTQNPYERHVIFSQMSQYASDGLSNQVVFFRGAGEQEEGVEKICSVFVISKEIDDVALPTGDEVFRRAALKKAQNNFVKTLKAVTNQTNVEIVSQSVNKMIGRHS